MMRKSRRKVPLRKQGKNEKKGEVIKKKKNKKEKPDDSDSS